MSLWLKTKTKDPEVNFLFFTTFEGKIWIFIHELVLDTQEFLDYIVEICIFQVNF